MKHAAFFPLVVAVLTAPVSAQQATPPPNNPPHFTSAIGDQTVDLDQPVTITLQAVDDEGDAFNIVASAVPGGPPLPPGGSINGTTYRWTPTTANTAGRTEFAVRFRAVDAAHSQETSQDVHIFIGDIQRPPRFLTPEISSQVDEGSQFSVTLLATDPNPADRPNLNFSLSGQPDGARIDSKTGVLTWTPSYTYVSPPPSTALASFTAVVSDGNTPVSLPIKLTVINVDIVHAAEWNRGVCQVRGDLTAVDELVKRYNHAAGRRGFAKSFFQLTAALIAAVTPFGDKIGGPDLPKGLGLGAAIVGVIAERLPEPGPRERQSTLLQRAQVDLTAAEQSYTPQTGDVRDPSLLRNRSEALATRDRVRADLAKESIIIPTPQCP